MSVLHTAKVCEIIAAFVHGGAATDKSTHFSVILKLTLKFASCFVNCTLGQHVDILRWALLDIIANYLNKKNYYTVS
jgi:hypothetical protein